MRFLSVVLILLAAGVAWWMLPDGICRGDSGDIQMAAATLGVAHPPGSALICILGHVFTRIWPGDPAAAYTYFNWLAGILALTWSWRLLRRMGVRTEAATAAALGLTFWPALWTSWVTPDVYLPTLLFQILAASSFVHWEATGRRRYLVRLSLALGCLVATRNTAVSYVPWAIIGVILTLQRNRQASRSSASSSTGSEVSSQSPVAPATSVRRLTLFTGVAVAFIAPICIALLYFWLRDDPATPYNYIATIGPQVNPYTMDQPDAETKLHRVIWEVSARQYWRYMNRNPRDVYHWLLRHTSEAPAWAWLTLLLMAGLAIGAIVHQWRRFRGSIVLLLGMLVGECAFLSTYHVQDILSLTVPVAWTLAMLAACGAEAVFQGVARELGPTSEGRVRTIARVCVVLLAAGWLARTGARVSEGPTPSAQRTAASVDWAKLPPRAVVRCNWFEFPVLSYGRYVLAGREDIIVIHPLRADPWPEKFEPHHAVYLHEDCSMTFPDWMETSPSRWTSRPQHGLWRVMTRAEAERR